MLKKDYLTIAMMRAQKIGDSLLTILTISLVIKILKAHLNQRAGLKAIPILKFLKKTISLCTELLNKTMDYQRIIIQKRSIVVYVVAVIKTKIVIIE